VPKVGNRALHARMNGLELRKQLGETEI
jgi:hypothetical protein